MEGTWVRYWDEGSTIAMLEFKVEQPVQQVPEPAVKEKKKKAKSMFLILFIRARANNRRHSQRIKPTRNL